MASIQPGPNLRKGTFYEGENCGGLQPDSPARLPSPRLSETTVCEGELRQPVTGGKSASLFVVRSVTGKFVDPSTIVGSIQVMKAASGQDLNSIDGESP